MTIFHFEKNSTYYRMQKWLFLVQHFETHKRIQYRISKKKKAKSKHRILSM